MSRTARYFRRTGRQPGSFLVIGLALTLLIWLMGGGFAWHSRATEEDRAHDMARGVAGTLAFNAAATLGNIGAALRDLSQELGDNWSRYTFERFRATALLRTGLSGVPAVRDAIVLDAQGNVLHRHDRPEPVDLSLADWAAFSAHATETDDILRLSVRPGADEPLTASRRITGPDGRFMGVVLMTLDRAVLQREMHAGRLWDGAVVGLHAADGTVLAQTSGAEHPPVPMPEQFAEALTDPQEPGAAAPDVSEASDGSDYIVAFDRVGTLPLAVGIAVPKAEALARWREDTTRYFLLLVTLTLVLVVTGLSLRRAVRALSENQRKVTENERRFRSIFNNAGAGIALVDDHGKVAEMNEEFARILHRDRGDLIGRDLLELSHPDDLESSAEQAWTVRRGEALSAQYEKRFLLPGGGTVWVEVSLSPQLDVASRDLAPVRPHGSVVVARDITSRRAAREVIQEKTRALERSNVELEEFAYVASHDLQEPLRTVASYLQLLERRHGDKLDGDARDYIRYAVDGAHRMSGLIQDLLQYSRVGRMGRPLAPLPLARPLASAVHGLASAIAENGASVSLPDDPPVILGDEPEITRLFQNLIGNAIKYRHPDRAPEVQVTLAEGEGEWIIAVADNGIGIEGRYFEKVFKIFQRLHGRDEYDGTGVGLSICKKIAERHGGRIWVTSTPGEGSVFRVALPKLKTEAARRHRDAEVA
ncbi:ATP-binding protein [Caenispirillum salinarum]|uniref:ATP-binding protein n=1 Tax=Caenispirillum salinarum TaxID=859058 RepID=UPI00384CA028